MSHGLPMAALVLSVVSIVWNLLLTHLRSPRITVEVRRHKVHLSDASLGSTVVLAVINHGTEAMTIRNIGLRADDQAWELDFEKFQREGGPLPKGPQLLPIRIEGHDCKIWEYSDDQFSCVNSNTKIWGYAERYRTFRFQLWPWAERTKRALSYRPALLGQPLAESPTINNVGHSPTTSTD
jgi:hypothetical protein